MNTRFKTAVSLAGVCLLAVSGIKPVAAQRAATTRTSRTNRSHQRPIRRTRKRDALTRSQAVKKLNDYNYVKYYGPISGRMYRSRKW